MLIRVELPRDEDAIRLVHARAFRRPEATDEEPIEARLVDDLRDSPEWIPELSIVAINRTDVVGHVVCTRAYVGADAHPVLGLGPLGVSPRWQHQGVGSELMRAAIAAADALGEPLIGLLGSPDFYGRFGFVTSTDHGVLAPERGWGKHFQVRVLRAYSAAARGAFRYAKPFDSV
ncbi:N-acetyltransferase [Pseudonocardiaceae bacterium YIM PH 21723]|nr:N-acetyltransferase [Pseudonocardiaceae bacterium YIM PH 21723]